MRLILLIPLLSLTDKEERTCLADYRNTNTDREYRESCSENIDFVREEWNCADMAAYFEDGSGGSDDVGSDTGS